MVAADLAIKASDHAAKMQAFARTKMVRKAQVAKLGHLVECKRATREGRRNLGFSSSY